MEKVIRIIQERDGIPYEEAFELVDICSNEIQECISFGGGYCEATEILECDLGLEPDYLEYLM
jgi:hypothetical protein